FICALGAGLVSVVDITSSDGPFPIGVSTQPGQNDISLQPSLLASVLLANTPQILCSYVFLGFNYLLTCMVTGREWISYSQRRQTLRVTHPAGEQRSTYYLQLPYHFSIPLLAISALLSWLTAQVLFIVRVRVRSGYSVPDGDSWILTCGYSPGAIVLTAIVGTVLALVIFVLGLKRYPNTMSLAGTNSAAIAAACHALPEDRDSALKPLQWGVVSQKDGVGHCSFSAMVVAPLIPGRIYN
ncbi:hypothetical protein MMC28_011077, partial [Mycoblastus sanguinarius]|nr:hypothetical protein [Mycoblastus sanguinarius]